jgi:hypothetical protein
MDDLKWKILEEKTFKTQNQLLSGSQSFKTKSKNKEAEISS